MITEFRYLYRPCICIETEYNDTDTDNRCRVCDDMLELPMDTRRYAALFEIDKDGNIKMFNVPLPLGAKDEEMFRFWIGELDAYAKSKGFVDIGAFTKELVVSFQTYLKPKLFGVMTI